MYASKVDTISFCPTCLSQGRKMFPFPLNYTKLPFSTFYKDLKLTAKDMVCWECRSFILRMAAFRHKALKAQANLAVSRIKPGTALQSLSKMAISKGINLDIFDSPEQPDPLIVDKIKTETDIDESNDYNELDEENYKTGDVKVEMCDENSEIHNENTEDIVYQVFYHKTRVAPECNKQNVTPNVTNDGNIANATLMSLLTRKSSHLPFPPIPSETTSKDSEYEIEINIEKQPKEPTTIAEPKDSQTVTKHFTEKRLTEEEMRRWWETKRENEYYAKSIPVFRCEKCVEPFYTRRSFLGHQKMHTEMYGELSCDICQLRFSNESAVAAHKDIHYRLLKCGHCAHVWDNPNSMRRHCYTEHRSPVTVWNCDVCSRQLTSHGKYLTHVRGHSSERCPDCGKKVKSANLNTHMLTHDTSLERKYECAECGRKYRTKDHVRIHILRMHNTETDGRWFCVDCNKHFRNATSYKTHMKFATRHVDAELLRYKCDECPRAFYCRMHLRRHVETTHSEQRNYPCDVCSARFRSPSARARHRRATHEGRVAPRDRMCHSCGKCFQTKAQLAMHMNTHTGARPFVCKLCGADFGHKGALYLHGRYKHKTPRKKKDGKKEDNRNS